MTEQAQQTPRTEREDFRQTSDPALDERADRGEAQLLGYRELYLLWERQQWATQDIDFTQDRIDWHERIPEEERVQRMYGLSSFFIGEQRVESELAPLLRAVPDEDMRIFLSTTIMLRSHRSSARAQSSPACALWRGHLAPRQRDRADRTSGWGR